MAIPSFDESGFLPAGIHECTLEEVRLRFGCFQATDRRSALFSKLQAFVREASAAGCVKCILVNGSFVTAKPFPNDIDLIIVVGSEHDFSAELAPSEYNVLSKRSVHRRFGFDLLVARENSVEFDRWVSFFGQVRLEPGQPKGILRLML